MRLIGNGGEHDHAEAIRDLAGVGDELLIASPFLLEHFGTWIESMPLSGLSRLHLVTSFQPRGDDQLRKPAMLLSLIDAVRKHAPHLGNPRIDLDNSLHGKVYLASDGRGPLAGIVTSANLTLSGLARNHEWGLWLEDSELLADLKEQILEGVEYYNITEPLLRILQLQVKRIEEQGKARPQPDVDIDLLSIVRNKAASRARATEGVKLELAERIHLKPYGTAEHPLEKESQEDFSAQRLLDFPRGYKPANVRPNDIILQFGTGCRCIVSVYQVLTFAEEKAEVEQARNPDARRWPYHVFGHNHTPLYGRHWFEYDLTIDRLSADYLSEYPDGLITEERGKTFGALNRGAGRVALDRDFGCYLIERILAVEWDLRKSGTKEE